MTTSSTDAFEDAEIAREGDRNDLAELIPLGFTSSDPYSNVFEVADAILAAGFTRNSPASTTAADLAETKRLLFGLDTETDSAKTIRQIHELAATAGMSHEWALDALRVISTAAADAWDEGWDAGNFYAIDDFNRGHKMTNPYRVAAPEGDGGNE